MKPTLVEAQSSSGYGKVPYTTSGPSKSTNTGDIRKNGYKNMILEINFWETEEVHFLSNFPLFQRYTLLWKLQYEIENT